MPQLKRSFVIDQILAALREGIAHGEWVGRLPAERRLAQDLKVGRNSLRQALQRLAAEGAVEAIPGRGRRLTGRPADPAAAGCTVVGLLAPVPLEQLRPRQALWVDELRGQLADRNLRLRYVAAAPCFGPNPARSLERLLAQERCAAWILVRSTRDAQSWFARRGTPAVIAGSCHEGVVLPSVDLDYRAMCRHAATLLLQRGHRRLAFLLPEARAAGELLSETGFTEGVAGFPARAEPIILRCGPDPEGAARCVRRLMAGSRPPSAIMVCQSYHYLTVFSVLASLGCRVPADVSLLCRDDDRFLAFVRPEPTRYVEDPRLYARKLVRLTETVLQGRTQKPVAVRLLPGLFPGASVAPPAPA